MQNDRLKKMITLAAMSGIAWVLMAVFRLPLMSAAPFLKYDVKDVIMVIGAFLYGPMAGFLMSVVVAFLEMITVSESGPIGFVMNVLSSCAFICSAAFIYKKKQTLSGAVIGLAAGAVLMTLVMILWNYLITPLYMGISRGAVAAMLIPVFLPFNLLKGVLNAAITLLLYKPIVTALRKAKLVPASTGGSQSGKINMGVMMLALLLLATGVLLVLVFRGII